jgi:hypothetical protein
MLVATAVVSMAAAGDVAVALQLAAYGVLLCHASLASSDHRDHM